MAEGGRMIAMETTLGSDQSESSCGSKVKAAG